MNYKYINRDTFEFVDNVFEVDELIADTVIVLNNKGYYTKYSCSGHVRDSRIYEMHSRVNDDNIGYIVSKDDGSYVKLIPYTFTTVYISFDDIYKFEILPDGFVQKGNVIELVIDYYVDGIRRKNSDIDDEIKAANKILLEWAISLSNK